MKTKRILDSDYYDMHADSIEEFFGTLQDSVVEAWRSHLVTDSYAQHIALNEFYTGMLELVDALIEDYNGIYGKVTVFSSVFGDFGPEMSPVDFLNRLTDFIIDGEERFLKDQELQSDVDAILSLIDSTKYKIVNLK